MVELHRTDRREFLKTTVVASAATLAAEAVWAADPTKPAVPLVTLGKTGEKVTRLGMGTSWAVAESFVQRAIAAGVRYIDTSETYERGNAEKTIGTVLDRTGKRKEVYLVTKNNAYGRAKGDARAKTFATRLDASLARLKTDYVDCYYMHGVDGRNIDVFRDPAIAKAYETLKKSGKIQFAGFSCHDEMLPEIIEAAAEAGWVDQMMIQFNFRTMDGDTIRRALDKAAKANIGIVAMKTQGGAEEFQPGEKDTRMNGLIDKGFKVHQAAIQAVFSDERIHTVVSEMTNFDQLRDNMAAAVAPARRQGGPPPRRPPPQDRERLLPRLRPPLPGRGRGCAGRDRPPLPPVLRGVREADRSPGALRGARGGRPRGRSPDRRGRRGLPALALPVAVDSAHRHQPDEQARPRL